MDRTGRWLSAVLAAVLAAPALPRATAQATRPAATAPAVPSAPAAPLTAAEYLAQLDARLLHGTSLQDRNEAAQRLAVIDTPASRDMLLQALDGNDREAQLACARAIAGQPRLDPRWVAPLVRLLPLRQSEPIARALARYDGNAAAMQALIDFARSQAPARARSAAIRDMGQMVQKSIAEALVVLVSDPAQDDSVRAAAADALAELSGQAGYGEDARQWTRWLAARAANSPAQWRQQVLDEQHPLLEGNSQRMAEQYRQFRERVVIRMEQIYTKQPPRDQPGTLLDFLNDPTPEIRAAGAYISAEAINLGQPIRDDVQQRLIELVGDASADVRLKAIVAVSKLSNPEALAALLTQLRVENDPDVTIAICEALPSLNSDRPVPELLRLLHDTSARVAAAAARALGGLAPVIEKNQIQAQRSMLNLQEVLVQRPAPPPNAPAPTVDELRRDVVLAMASLHEVAQPRQIFTQFLNLATQDPSPRVRAAALLGLGSLGPEAADSIVQSLKQTNEPDPAVREAAAKALGLSGSVAHAGSLVSSMGPDEPNPDVRRQARESFLLLLPRMPAHELTNWYQAFLRQKDARDEIAVLNVLVQLLAKQKNLPELAVQQQNLGALYLDQKQPNEAIPLLQSALAFYQANRGGANVPTVIDELMKAYLMARRYDDAVDFAQQQINRDPQNQPEVIPSIRNQASDLIRQGKKGNAAAYADARTLLDAALNMKENALPAYARAQLEELRSELPANGTPSQPK